MAVDRSWLYLIVGGVLLIGSIWAGHAVLDTDYVHSFDEDYGGDQLSFNASHEGHIRYANLSAHGQQVVDRMIERGEYVVTTDDGTVDEFTYATGPTNPGAGLYVVQRGVQNYTIHAYKDTPGFVAFLLSPFVAVVAVVGFLLCIWGLFTL